MSASLRDIHFAAERGEPLHLTAEGVRELADDVEAAVSAFEDTLQGDAP